MAVRYNDDYRHTKPWWMVDLADLTRRHDDGTQESEQDACDRLQANTGLYGRDPLDILIAQEEHTE